MRSQLCVAAAFVAVALWASPAAASSITPTYDSFGTLAGATFRGSGIPNDAVAITTWTDGTVTVVLGLTAHERFFNDPVSTDGAGTFFADPGANYGDPLNASAPTGSPSSTLGATWNFAFYVSITGATAETFRVDLLYDFDPAAGTDETAHGVITSGAIGNVLSQGSENLAFAYLTSGIPGLVVPPAGTFDPFASGQYTFALRLFNTATTAAPTLLAQSAIQVNVGEVPEPATLSLLGLGLVAGARRMVKMKKRASLASGN